MYKRNRNSAAITRLSDGATIPPDPANADYANYLADMAADPSCVAEADPPSVDELNAPILAQIVALEAKQSRPLREIALGDDAAKTRLQAINNHIVALRAKLLK